MAAGSIPCVTKLCPHLTVDFRTPGNFTARPKTSCLVALPGVLVLSFARTLPRSFARTLPEGSGTGFGRVQLGGASPQIEVCHTELCQVFARELCQVFARRFSSLTPMRAWGVELCPQGTMERPSYIGTYITLFEKHIFCLGP